jgi:thiopeptide-type bacteriocin biosynthesis protein
MNTLSDSKYLSPFFILRSPLLSLSTARLIIVQLQQGKPLLGLLLQQLKAEPLIREAVYLASPELYDQIMQLQENDSRKVDTKKLEETLYKYFMRMCTNSTPFGLFAGYTIGAWGEQVDIRLGREKDVTRKIRMDMEYLCAVARHMSGDGQVEQQLRYYSNNSIYQVGKEIRYTECRTDKNNKWSHHIESIQATEELLLLLESCRAGKHFREMIQLVVQAGHDQEQAIDFIKELIRHQVLVSELTANVTGKHYQQRIAHLLAGQGVNFPFLDNIDHSTEDQVTRYKNIFTTLAGQPVKVCENRMIQVDCFKAAEQCKLPAIIQQELWDAIELLARLNPTCAGALRIKKFRRAFYERYEDRAVPLAEVLDPQIGIGYQQASTIADYYRTPNPYDDPNIEFKFQKYKESMFSPEGHVVLTELDKANLPINDEAIPDSLFSIISLTGNEEAHKIVFHYAGGPSAANLLGRFADADAELEEKITALCLQEESNDPGKIYAEVVHLSQPRFGNILSRPIFRKYEIPYLAFSTLPPEQQIPLSDLYLLLKNGKLILYSKSRQKEVIPRLSSAHNFSDGLPVYNFLGDLQCQDKQGDIYWDWGVLKSQASLPRIEYKNIVLSPATWSLQADQLSNLLNGQLSIPQISAAIDQFRTHWRMPSLVHLIEGDNSLVLDLSTDFGKQFLLKQLKQKKYVRLQEYVNPGNNNIVKGPSGAFSNEFIIPFLKQQQAAKAQTPALEVKLNTTLQRKFIPGSEWIYFKIYIVPESTDELLTIGIHPLIKEVEQKQLIQKWFFLRYADPRDHIRLRLQLVNTADIGQVIEKVYQALHPFSQLNIIQGVQIDTYVRELERYGEATMELSEKLFSINSDLVCELITLMRASQSSRLLTCIAILVVDRMFKSFGYSEENIIELTTQVMKEYEGPAAAKKTFRNGLYEFYRENSLAVAALLSGENIPSALFPYNEWPAIQDLIEKNAARMETLYQELLNIPGNNEQPSASLLLSYTHMFLNRLITDYSVDAENKIYCFLNKFYVSRKARSVVK